MFLKIMPLLFRQLQQKGTAWMWPFFPSNPSVKHSCCGMNNFNVGLLQVCTALENCIGSNGYLQKVFKKVYNLEQAILLFFFCFRFSYFSKNC